MHLHAYTHKDRIILNYFWIISVKDQTLTSMKKSSVVAYIDSAATIISAEDSINRMETHSG